MWPTSSLSPLLWQRDAWRKDGLPLPAGLFDPPARLGRAHGLTPPGHLRTELDHQVFRRLLLFLRPFHQQPFLHPLGMSLLPADPCLRIGVKLFCVTC
jgi:hypothetical protein